MYTPQRIRSIGWLNNHDGSKTLTPCVDGNSMPERIAVSADELKSVSHDIDAMKEMACEKLNA